MGQSAAVQKLAAAVVILLLGAVMGYLMYSTKYKPAVAAKASAKTAYETAEADVAAKQTQLEELKKKPKASKEPTAKYLVAKTAIPQQPLLAEARIQIEDISGRAGVVVENASFQDGGSGDPNAAGASGPIPLKVEITGTARYSNFLMFMQLLHEEVGSIDGKVYVKGRLINVNGWSFGSSGASTPGADGNTSIPDGSGKKAADPQAKAYTVSITLYSDGSGDATTGEPAGTVPGAGGATVDAATAGATGGAAPGGTAPGGATAPGASTTTPGGTTPASAAAAPPGTSPSGGVS